MLLYLIQFSVAERYENINNTDKHNLFKPFPRNSSYLIGFQRTTENGIIVLLSCDIAFRFVSLLPSLFLFIFFFLLTYSFQSWCFMSCFARVPTFVHFCHSTHSFVCLYCLRYVQNFLIFHFSPAMFPNHISVRV